MINEKVNYQSAKDIRSEGNGNISAQGNPVLFDDALAGDATSLKVKLEPVQDLHTYGKPWKAGTNINLFKATEYRGDYNKSAGSDLKNSDNVGDYYFGRMSASAPMMETVFTTINAAWAGRMFATDPLSAGVYTIHSFAVGKTAGNLRASLYITDSDLVVVEKLASYTSNTTQTMLVVTLDENQRIAFAISDTAACTAYIGPLMVNAGGEMLDYVPFENICPITAHTGCTVSRPGINQWDEEWELGGIDQYGELVTNDTDIRSKNFCAVLPNTEYYVKGSAAVILYDSEYHYIDTLVRSYTDEVLTTPSNAAYFKIWRANTTTYADDLSINYPSTDTSYHAYDGGDATLDFGTSVYGCEADFITGNVSVNTGFYASYNGETLPGKWISDRDEYTAGGTPTVGAQVAYELASPTSIQVTPSSLSLLAGRNFVYSSGEVDMKYLSPYGNDVQEDINYLKQAMGGAVWGGITGTLSNQTDLQNALNGKVDAVTGKQLSTEDYTTAEKTKLTALPDAATLNADLASKQSLLQVTQSISGGYLYNNYYSVS